MISIQRYRLIGRPQSLERGVRIDVEGKNWGKGGMNWGEHGYTGLALMFSHGRWTFEAETSAKERPNVKTLR